MARNKLTPAADLATRAFFKTVNNDESYLKDSPAHRRQIIAILLEALNYQVLAGRFISNRTQIAIPFGSNDYSAYPCEWAADEERANEANTTEDTPEASASSESSDTEVREAVLSEDVQ